MGKEWWVWKTFAKGLGSNIQHPAFCLGKNRAACRFWSGTWALPEVEHRAVRSWSDSSQHFPYSSVPLTADTRSETRSTFVSREAFLSNVCQLQYLLTEHTAQNPVSQNEDMRRGTSSSTRLLISCLSDCFPSGTKNWSRADSSVWLLVFCTVDQILGWLKNSTAKCIGPPKQRVKLSNGSSKHCCRAASPRL